MNLSSSHQMTASGLLLPKKISAWQAMENSKAYSSGNKCVDDSVHPVTGTRERYCLYDRFHEKNSHNPADVLRRITLCPQLHTNFNSESHEQLHQILNKDNYFLNMMNPATHVFMKWLLIHLRNWNKNEQEQIRQGDAMKKHRITGAGQHG